MAEVAAAALARQMPTQMETVYLADVETNICVLCTALSGLPDITVVRAQRAQAVAEWNESGAGRVLLSLMFRRSSFEESALRIASSYEIAPSL